MNEKTKQLRTTAARTERQVKTQRDSGPCKRHRYDLRRAQNSS